MNRLSLFKAVSRKLSNDFNLPPYQAENIVARLAGALTMADLMRKINFGEPVKIPGESEILEKVSILNKKEKITESTPVSVEGQDKYYMLVPR